MALKFADTFAGSGTLDGHTPETAFGSNVWDVPDTGSHDLTLSGGAVASANQGSPTDYGGATYGDTGADYGIRNSLEITFVMRTGADVTPASNYGVQLTFGHSGLSYGITLNIDYLSGDWALNSLAVTLAPNTDYTGTLEISDGTQQLVFLGQTIDTTDPYSNTKGFNYIGMNVGAGFSIKSLDVDGVVTLVTTEATSEIVFSSSASVGFIETQWASEIEFASEEVAGHLVASLNKQAVTFSSAAESTLAASTLVQSSLVLSGQALAPLEATATSSVVFASSATQGVAEVHTSSLSLSSETAGNEVTSLLDDSSLVLASSVSDDNTGNVALSELVLSSTATSSNHATDTATSAIEFGDSTSEDRVVSDMAYSTLTLESAATSVLAAVDVALSELVFSSQILRDPLAKAWVMNASTAAMSRYAGLPFRSFAAVGGHMLALGEDGFFELSGIEDDETPIEGEVTTGYERMGSEHVKRINDIVVYHQSTEPVDVHVTEWGSERGSFTYTLDAQPDPSRRGRRVKVGRGLRASAFKFSFRGQIQSFEDASILPVASEVDRRF